MAERRFTGSPIRNSSALCRSKSSYAITTHRVCSPSPDGWRYANPGAGQGLLSYALTEVGLIQGRADWKPVDRFITTGEWPAFAVKEVPLQWAAQSAKPHD